MICPFCEQEGKKSTLTGYGSLKTCMGHSPFYDEDGTYHAHDPNKIQTTYQCSNGHTFVKSYYAKCPGCDYKKKEVEIKLIEHKNKQWTAQHR